MERFETQQTIIYFKANDGKTFSDENDCLEYEKLKNKYKNRCKHTENYGFYKCDNGKELEELILKWLGYEYGSHLAFKNLWNRKIKNNIPYYVNKYIYFDYEEGDYGCYVDCRLLDDIITIARDELEEKQKELNQLERLLND